VRGLARVVTGRAIGTKVVSDEDDMMMVLRQKKVRKNEIEKKKSYVDQSGDGRLGVAQTPPLLLGRVDEGVGLGCRTTRGGGGAARARRGGARARARACLGVRRARAPIRSRACPARGVTPAPRASDLPTRG
jgi:hypothetical protein